MVRGRTRTKSAQRFEQILHGAPELSGRRKNRKPLNLRTVTVHQRRSDFHSGREAAGGTTNAKAKEGPNGVKKWGGGHHVMSPS